ncbi:hypothetical protein HDV00_011652 [Rhizophlyctis rosea]|nr:hypothetical protein HDV00_011652 [Rhizophlyctis rosea]
MQDEGVLWAKQVRQGGDIVCGGSGEEAVALLELPEEVLKDVLILSKTHYPFLACKYLYSLWENSKSLKARYLLALYGPNSVLFRPELRAKKPIRVPRQALLHIRYHPYFDEDVFMILATTLGAQYKYHPLFPDADEPYIGSDGGSDPNIDPNSHSSQRIGGHGIRERMVSEVVADYDFGGGTLHWKSRRTLQAKLPITDPWRWAASNGYTRALSFLLQNGADTEAIDPSGFPYGFLAINSIVNKTGREVTPENVAKAKRALLSVLSLLPTIEDHPEWLDWAVWPSVMWNDYSLTKILTDRGGKLTTLPSDAEAGDGVPDDAARVALAYTVKYNNFALFKLLAIPGIEGVGPTAIEHSVNAACETNNVEILAYIYETFPEWTGMLRLKPLQKAVGYKSLDVTRWLLAAEQIRHHTSDHDSLSYALTYATINKWQDIFTTLLTLSPSFRIMPLVGDLLSRSRWDWDLQNCLVALCVQTQKDTITPEDIIPMLFSTRPGIEEQERHVAGIVRRVLKGEHDYELRNMVVNVWSCVREGGRVKGVEALRRGEGGEMGRLLVELVDEGVEVEYDMISGNWKEWILFVDLVGEYRRGKGVQVEKKVD